MNDFSENLKTHLSFIARSCELYDQGHKEEALRVAVSLRVMFHDTAHSISLLKHLQRKESIHLISTFASQKSMSAEYGNVHWHTVIPVMLTSRGVQAPTNSWPTRSVLVIDDWWQEQIWLEGAIALSRKDIILSAANQDGGAHVDANPNEKTRKVKRGPDATVRINGKLFEGGMSNHHLPLIRQMAYEVLECKGLYELAKST
ncbi:hypothetical protein [Methylotenera sp. L2L1]|jgi:hypothetical protein|uniref:hypothetical protein n=1 Tax=Methylotenera sp. L2L1 TaxID=1502770 RepID=UPI000560AC3B|nr:hypothetical protein [Methylotenera sp. L2L1]